MMAFFIGDWVSDLEEEQVKLQKTLDKTEEASSALKLCGKYLQQKEYCTRYQ
jgi:exonuclease VII small subunit